MDEPSSDGEERIEALADVLNLRVLLYSNAEARRLLAVGRAIRAGVPREFWELSPGGQERAWSFARMPDDEAQDLALSLEAHRRYLERAIENEGHTLLDLRADDLRYLDRLLRVWQKTRDKPLARTALNNLGHCLRGESGGMAVTVAYIDGEIEVEQVPVPPHLRQRAKAKRGN
ncbi:MAG TPA: hypothetical protein VD926_12975 [Acidimicrobiales bacterium]|nr:hypothetical protein [Acidimicrobiales bacterium]